MENNDRRKDSDTNTSRIADFCRRNVKYISAGVLLLALVAVIAVTTLNGKDSGDAEAVGDSASADGTEVSDGSGDAQGDAQEETQVEYQVDVPEVKELVSTYYNSYAIGDVDKLSTITKSLSDMEKSYIKMMDGYVEEYNDIVCYTKAGLEEGSYMASVAFNMRFQDVEGDLPGMDFFYIRTDDDGKLYIDNLYSSFNREIKEQPCDEAVEAAIQSFESGDDVQKLLTEFQDKYNKAVDSDQALKDKVDEVADAIKSWASAYSADGSTQVADASGKDNADATGQGDAGASGKDDADATGQGDATEQGESEATGEGDASVQGESDATEQSDASDQGDASAQQDEGQQEEGDDGSQESDEDGGSEVNYVPEGKVLTASDGYNVRTSMSETSEALGVTAVGDEIKVILSYAEGWTKVEWSGKTGYIRTDLLLNN